MTKLNELNNGRLIVIPAEPERTENYTVETKCDLGGETVWVPFDMTKARIEFPEQVKYVCFDCGNKHLMDPANPNNLKSVDELVQILSGDRH